MSAHPRWVAVPPLVLLVGAFASCEVDHPSAVLLDMHAPAGILDQATSVTLSVFDPGGAVCDATGSPGMIPANAKSFDLKANDQSCSPGTRCQSLTLTEDKSTKMFAVNVSNASGTLALGCTTAKIDQDPLTVSIKLVAFVQPACCNDGTLQTGELCDTGVKAGAACSTITPTESCRADCTTTEIPVDRAPGAAAPAPSAMSQIALTFAPGSGQLSNGLRAAFSNNSNPSNPDVDIRVLTSDVTAVTTPSLLTPPQPLPLLCSNIGGSGQARNQNSPAIAPLANGNLAVVYLSDQQLPGMFNVFTTALDGTGCAAATGQQVNTTPNGATTPDIAAGPNGALIVWAQGGSIFGRTFDGTTLGASVVMLGSGSGPRVAATKNGFIVAYAGSGAGDPDGVFYETVSATGQVGAPILVNAKTTGVQDQPAIAAFADGRFAVAFRSGGDIFVQRYDASGTAVAGDQDAAFDTTSPGGESTPAIASGTSPTKGDFFVCAWATANGDIAARLAGGSSGFLFNQVNGQNSDFVVNITGESGMRAHPAVTVGTGYIVFGWEDTSPSQPGVFVRRFPLPQ